MKRRGIALADLPEKLRIQAYAQLSTPSPPVEVTPGPPERRLRQDQKPVLNALETRFLEKLQLDHALFLANGTSPLPLPEQLEVYAQAMRFELARGIWYKADFFLPKWSAHKIVSNWVYQPVAYEVKGPKAFRGGFENLKVAARVHSWCKFFLVWEDENRTWQRQEILP